MQTPTINRAGRKPKVWDFESLPNQARKLRLSKGLSLHQVAKEIGVKSPALLQFERENRGIRQSRRWRLAAYLGVPIQELMTPGKIFAENYGNFLKQP